MDVKFYKKANIQKKGVKMENISQVDNDQIVYVNIMISFFVMIQFILSVAISQNPVIHAYKIDFLPQTAFSVFNYLE